MIQKQVWRWSCRLVTYWTSECWSCLSRD